MSLTPEAAAALVAQLETDAALMHQIVHGDAATVVATEGGNVDSLARKLAWIAAQIGDEVTGLASKQPLDADLTAIAALATTAYGRALLTLADGASLRGLTNGREVLTANRTYYVSTTGSDLNDGLTMGAPFATVAKAFSTVAAKLDTASYTVTIQLADGTYTNSVGVIPQWLGGGKIIVNGNGVNPSNVVVHSTTGQGTFNLSVPGNLQVQNMKITAAGTGASCLYADGAGARIDIGPGVIFGASVTAHIYSNNGADYWTPNSYTIVGGGQFHFAALGGKVRFASGITVTLTGTPAFSTRYAHAANGGSVSAPNQIFSGAAIGQRHFVGAQSFIFTNGADPLTYFPGNSAGATGAGGQFI